jgi:hypothetical protein
LPTVGCGLSEVIALSTQNWIMNATTTVNNVYSSNRIYITCREKYKDFLYK